MVKTQNLLDVETHEVWLNLTTRHFFEGLLPLLGLVRQVDFFRLADNPVVLNLISSFVICFHPCSSVALKSCTSVTCTKPLLL